MRLLLDTNAFLWADANPRRLGARRADVEDADLLVSTVVAWEIAIKFSIGRLQLRLLPERYFGDAVRELAATRIGIDDAHALAVAELPMHHRDPFDRLLIAQAQALGVPILTADRAFELYDVELLLIEPT